jgi:hypothetical protein
MKLLAVTALWVVFPVVVSPLLALDTDLLKYVGPDTKSVAGIYVDRAVSSPLGLFLQSQAGGENRDFQKFMAVTGFDPRHDLREVIVASSDVQHQKNGLIIGRGQFNAAQIGALVLLQGGTKELYGGVDVYSASARHGQAFAFPEPGVALLGDAVSVKAAIDNRGQALALDPRLAAKMQAVSARYDMWFASTGAQNIPLGKAWKSQDGVDVVSGGVTLGSIIQLNAEAVMRSEKDAQSLVGIIKMITGMAQFQQQKNPEIARIFAILNGAETKVDGMTVLFSISAPQSDLELLFKGPRKVAVLRQ